MLRLAFSISLLYSFVAWLVLLYWYGLFANYHAVHFAFDKVAGHVHSLQLQLTALLFVSLSLGYSFQYWYLARQKHLNWSQWLIIGIVLYGCSITALFLYPVGALDVYYYAASLKLFFMYGLNPYLVPFSNFPFDSFYQFTIAPFQLFPYGPIFLLISGIPLLITGMNDMQITVIGLKFLNLVLFAILTQLLYRYHQDKQKKLMAVFFFAANPLVLFEALSNVHNDLMLSLFLVISVTALQKKSLLSGFWFCLSFLTKIFTFALAPLFIWQLKQQIGIKKTGVSLFIGMLVCILALFPFWEQGKLVSGMLAGMSSTQTFYNISLYSLIKDLIRFHPAMQAYLGILQPCFIALFIGISLRIIQLVGRGHSLISGVLQTYLWFLILLSIFYQWYLLPVLALISLNPTRKNLMLGFLITLFGLTDYLLSVFFWFDLALDAYINHFIRSLFLTFPILFYLLSELRLNTFKSK